MLRERIPPVLAATVAVAMTGVLLAALAVVISPDDSMASSDRHLMI